MLIIVCDECGERGADQLQLAGGHIVYAGMSSDPPFHLQVASVDLCRKHWPKDGDTQPNNCKSVKFVYDDDTPPEVPFGGPTPPVTRPMMRSG